MSIRDDIIAAFDECEDRPVKLRIAPTMLRELARDSDLSDWDGGHWPPKHFHGVALEIVPHLKRWEVLPTDCGRCQGRGRLFQEVPNLTAGQIISGPDDLWRVCPTCNGKPLPKIEGPEA